MCLGKHYIDAQKSKSIFPLSYNELSNKSAFFFSFGGANKKRFFISTTKRIRGLLVPISVPASNLPQSFFHERLAKLRSLEILAGTVARNVFTWKVWKSRGHVFLPIKQHALSLFLMRVLKQSGEWYAIKGPCSPKRLCALVYLFWNYSFVKCSVLIGFHFWRALRDDTKNDCVED